MNTQIKPQKLTNNEKRLQKKILNTEVEKYKTSQQQLAQLNKIAKELNKLQSNRASVH